MHIPAYSVVCKHVQELCRHIQTYSEPCITQAYPEPEAYSETWHTQNPGIFKSLSNSEKETYSEPEVFSEPCQTSIVECFAKIVHSYNFFHKLQLCSEYQLFILYTL